MASDEPVHLSEDAATGDRFLIYAADGGVKVEVRYEAETLWITQAQMADLFGRDVSVISRHIANVIEEGELPSEGDLHILQIRGPGNRPLCAMCQDYDGTSEAAREFYQNMQAKLFWAVTTSTPSMVLMSRASAKAPNMGLQVWPKDEPRQQDALVAKNYLAPPEIEELNRLTTILLDIFDDQLKIGRLTLMSEASALLDQQLRQLNRSLLRGGGTVKHSTAEAHAKTQYKRFDTARKIQRRAEVAAQLAELKAAQQALPKAQRKVRNKPAT